jgi:hypothetical protein
MKFLNPFFKAFFFAKLRKDFIFVLTVCLSVRMKQRTSFWTDLNEIWYLSTYFFFTIYEKKNSISIKIRQE